MFNPYNQDRLGSDLDSKWIIFGNAHLVKLDISSRTVPYRGTVFDIVV